MKTYTLDKYHKIEVAELEQDYEVRFFEKWNGTWVELNKSNWVTLEDIEWYYDI